MLSRINYSKFIRWIWEINCVCEVENQEQNQLIYTIGCFDQIFQKVSGIQSWKDIFSSPRKIIIRKKYKTICYNLICGKFGKEEW